MSLCNTWETQEDGKFCFIDVPGEGNYRKFLKGYPKNADELLDQKSISIPYTLVKKEGHLQNKFISE